MDQTQKEKPKYERLGDIFASILSPDCPRKANVYYQPPRNTQMEYPCIVYNLSTGDTQFADNRPYIYKDRYSVQFISKSPNEEEIHRKIVDLPMCIFSRFFTMNNLNHWNYDIYF